MSEPATDPVRIERLVDPERRTNFVKIAVRVGLLCAWMAAGIYGGAATFLAGKIEGTPEATESGDNATYSYDGVNFLDQQSLVEFVRSTAAGQWFPWVFSVPQELIPLLTAVAFGAVGGVIRLLKQRAIDHTPIEHLSVASAPAFGALVGTMLCFLTLTPAFAMSKSIQTRPESLAGLSLLGGAFSEVAYAWIEQQARRIFEGKRKAGTHVPSKKK